MCPENYYRVPEDPAIQIRDNALALLPLLAANSFINTTVSYETGNKTVTIAREIDSIIGGATLFVDVTEKFTEGEDELMTSVVMHQDRARVQDIVEIHGPERLIPRSDETQIDSPYERLRSIAATLIRVVAENAEQPPTRFEARR